jgi:NAD(P)-dependent dehydrogenase (short-subunit alcohol dehydrogenase family)
MTNLIDRMNLTGRNALVTGSSQGIGRAIALTMAQSGANVLVHCRNETEAGQAVADEVSRLGVNSGLLEVDLMNSDAAQQLLDQATNRLGKIDILVLNASVQIKKDWLSITADEFTQQATVNWQRTFELMQVFAPPMQTRSWGRILAIGSVQQLMPHPQMPVYAATKAAVLNLVRSLAAQLAKDGVTVNNLAPGVIATDRNTDALSDKSYREQLRSRIPVGYFGEPHDCAALAALLCSEAGRYITGQDIFVDGGMSL